LAVKIRQENPDQTTVILPTIYFGCKRLSLLLACLIALFGCSDQDSPTATYKIADQSLLSAAYSRDATKYFVGALHHGGSLWKTSAGQISTSERLYDWNHNPKDYSAIRVAAFSANGQYVATTEGNSMALWSTETGESQRYWQSPTRIIDLDISSTGEYALLALDNQSAVLFNLMRGGIVGTLRHDETISSVSINDEATLALTGANDGIAWIWSLEDGNPLFELSHKFPVNFVALSPSGDWAITAAYQGGVYVWSTKTGKKLVELFRVNPGITALEFSDTEDQILIGTARESILLAQRASGETIKRWKIPNNGPWHKAAVVAVSFGDQKSSLQQYHAIGSTGFAYTLPDS
jgi:WD40 repeat protein